MMAEKRSPENLRSAWAEPYDKRYATILSRTLSSSQTLFMTLNLVLGIGFFQNITYAVSVAGVAGAILAFVAVGVVACCVMEGLLEMVTLFPIPNAMVEYVRAFVDPELAHIIGIGYWLSYSVYFVTFLISAANTVSSMVDISGAARAGIIISIFLVLVAINLFPVYVLANIERVSGAIKLALLVAVVTIFSFAAVRSDSTAESWSRFGSNGYSTKSNAQAIFAASSLAVYPFIGIESIATMSFETLNPAKGLKWTSCVGFLVLCVYVLLTIAIGVNGRQHDAISTVYQNPGMGGIVPVPIWEGSKSYNAPATTDLLVNAGFNANVLNGFYVYTAISAGSTALYVASRTLFGMVRRPIQCNFQPLKTIIQGVGHVTQRTRAPRQAILVSSFIFFWAALLVAQLKHGDHFDIVQTLVGMAINMCVLVWALQCVATLRYWRWKEQFETEADSVFASGRSRHLILRSLQPYPTILGLVGCVLLAVVSNGSSLWTNHAGFGARFCGSYLTIIILISSWLMLKLNRFVAEPRDEFEWFITIQDRVVYTKTILQLQSQIYPADYAVDDRIPRYFNSSKFVGTTRELERGTPAVIPIDYESRSYTQSSGETNSDAEPRIAYILDTGTIEQKPGMSFPIYGSRQPSMREEPRSSSQSDIGIDIRSSESFVPRFPPIREQSG